MRVSSRCILIENNKVLLIYRERDGEKYYVFPGGGIEDNETKEDCISRECKEELGIDINIKKYVYEVKGKDFIQHFFLIERKSGEVGTGNPEEYDVNRVGGVQIPKFINISELSKLDIVSPPIVKQFLEDFDNYGVELDNKVKTINDY